MSQLVFSKSSSSLEFKHQELEPFLLPEVNLAMRYLVEEDNEFWEMKSAAKYRLYNRTVEGGEKPLIDDPVFQAELKRILSVKNHHIDYLDGSLKPLPQNRHKNWGLDFNARLKESPSNIRFSRFIKEAPQIRRKLKDKENLKEGSFKKSSLIEEFLNNSKEPHDKDDFHSNVPHKPPTAHAVETTSLTDFFTPSSSSSSQACLEAVISDKAEILESGEVKKEVKKCELSTGDLDEIMEFLPVLPKSGYSETSMVLEEGEYTVCKQEQIQEEIEMKEFQCTERDFPSLPPPARPVSSPNAFSAENWIKWTEKEDFKVTEKPFTGHKYSYSSSEEISSTLRQSSHDQLPEVNTPPKTIQPFILEKKRSISNVCRAPELIGENKRDGREISLINYSSNPDLRNAFQTGSIQGMKASDSPRRYTDFSQDESTFGEQNLVRNESNFPCLPPPAYPMNQSISSSPSTKNTKLKNKWSIRPFWCTLSQAGFCAHGDEACFFGKTKESGDTKHFTRKLLNPSSLCIGPRNSGRPPVLVGHHPFPNTSSLLPPKPTTLFKRK